MNEKVANQRVKHLEMMIKYEDVTKIIRKTNTNKTSLSSIKCKMCDKYLSSTVKLEEHQQLHCDICGEIFQKIVQLKKHENIVGQY